METLPSLLLPLDVLECVHPFAFHVTSWRGGELSISKNKYEMNSECQISDGNTWVHRLAHPQQFLPDLYSLRTVPSVGKVRIANYAFCEQHHHQWAKEFLLELPLSLRGLKHQFTKESRTLIQVLNHIKRRHKALVGFVRISNIKDINLVLLPW